MASNNKRKIKAKQEHSDPVLLNTTIIKPAKLENWMWVLLGVSILIVSYVRLRLIKMPLERDEGEYAYMGQLILHGLMPYKDAYNMKLPGTYFMYSVFEFFFGQTGAGIHIGLWIINIITTLLIFISVKKLFTPIIALFTSIGFAFVSVSENIFGFAAHATHFVVFFVALSLFFYSKYAFNRKWFYAGLTGLMFGTAFLMKQQAIFFILFGGVIILLNDIADKQIKIKKALLNILSYSFAVIIPYLIIVFVMYVSGNLEKFWYWTFQYAAKYIAEGTISEGMKYLESTFNPMWQEFNLFWVFFFIGLITLWISKCTLKQKLFAFFFVVFSFLTTCPGYYFRPHYFISFIPAAALLSAISIDFVGVKLSSLFNFKKANILSTGIFAIIILTAVIQNINYFFYDKPELISKVVYGSNPFNESIKIARYIKDHSIETDKIAILGSEPQILFYSDRKSVTGFLYTYNMMEVQDYNKKMQHDMINEMENGKPLYIVYCNVSNSWLRKANSPPDIFEWFQKYVIPKYKAVGLVDLVSRENSNYYWDEEAGRAPEGQEYIVLFKRNS